MEKDKIEEKIKSLAWKYFAEQKLFEIAIIIGAGIALVGIPYAVGLVHFNYFPPIIKDFKTDSFMIYLTGASDIVIVVLGCFVGWIILNLIHSWLVGNWEKAIKRAKDDFEDIKR